MTYKYEELPPGWTSYRGKRFVPTPEQVAQVRRWVEQQDEVLKARLRKLDAPKR
jgi:hypothetical protein